MIAKVKGRSLLWLVFTILFLSLTGIFGFVIKFHRYYHNIPSEHLIGNRVSNVRALKGKGFPFSFLVIGDTQSREKAETLIKLALKKGRPSFMVILGDFVKTPDLWSHRFFLTEMTVEIKPPFPVFLVAGNHDIDHTSSKKISDERRVTPEIYESLYGARNFDFIFNDCLFIICGVDPKNPASYLNDLRDTLSKKGEGRKYIFVFVHFPPKGLAEYIEGSLPNGDEFLSLLEDHKVTTSFFGDFHGYWRGQRKGVNLIVSGGGGGRLKQSQPEWGKFHHILRVNVDNDIIGEEVVTSPDEFSFEDFFEDWLFTYFFPAIKDKKLVPYCFFFLFLSSGIYSFIFFFNSLKKKKSDEPCSGNRSEAKKG